MKTLTVDTDTLNDLLHATSHQTYHYWQSVIEKNYPSSVIVDHPIVKSFKFFTAWPGTLVFYVDTETNRIVREALVVRSKFYSDKMHEEIDFEKAILLGVFAKSMDDKQDNLVVRYAIATHDILPYRFNE
jgi:hypothetical protein